MKKLFWHIVDPALGHRNSGHHLSYNEALHRHLAAERLPHRFYGHAGANRNGILDFEWLPAFRSCHYEGWPRYVGHTGSLKKIVLTVRDLFRLPAPSRESANLYFFHTVDDDQLLAILIWMALRPPRPDDRVAVMLRYDAPRPGGHGTKKPGLARSLLARLRYPRLALVSDSKRLAKAHGEVLRRPVTALPIPHCPAAPVRKKAAGLTFGYVGNSRIEKGYVLLPDIIIGLYRRIPGAKLIVQSEIGERDDPRLGDAFDRIAFLQGEFGFRHHQGPAGQEAYDGWLAECDAVLLPYDPVIYRDRTSGILCDALGAGAVPIVTGDTWMADQLAGLAPDFRLTPGYDAKEFVDAALRLADDRQRFQSAYAGLWDGWKANNSASGLLAGLAEASYADATP